MSNFLSSTPRVFLLAVEGPAKRSANFLSSDLTIDMPHFANPPKTFESISSSWTYCSRAWYPERLIQAAFHRRGSLPRFPLRRVGSHSGTHRCDIFFKKKHLELGIGREKVLYLLLILFFFFPAGSPPLRSGEGFQWPKGLQGCGPQSGLTVELERHRLLIRLEPP